MKSITTHYKEFFGLQNRLLEEDDHLNIDWARAYVEDLQAESVEALLKKFESLNYKAFGFPALQIAYKPIEKVWECGLRNEDTRKSPQVVVGFRDNNKNHFEDKELKVCLAELYKYCQEKGYLE